MDTAGSKLKHQVYRQWRIAATGLAFALFGIGGPIIALAITLTQPLPISPIRRRVWTRRCINGAFWCYIRTMAQTVAAYAGLKRRQRGREPNVGFLLGTRSFDVNVPCFKHGEAVRIKVKPVLESDNDISLFQCELHDCRGQNLGNAQLKGVQPKNPTDFI